MKKLGFLLIIIYLLTLLTSCTVVEGTVSDRISSPDNNLPPIEGKWEIDKVLKSSLSHFSEDEVLSYIGSEALFHKDAVIIRDSYTTKPSYKIKKVDAGDYLLFKYKVSPRILGIEDEKIEVITIFNENAYFHEFIRLNDDTMIVSINDSFFSLKRTVEKVSVDEIQRYINVEKSMLRTFGAVEDEVYQTGVMIGLKVQTFDELNQVPMWQYKTIWINSQNKVIDGIYELDQLLMPRKNGFWIIESNRNIVDESIIDELIALPQFRKEDTAMIEDELLETSNIDMALREQDEEPMAMLSQEEPTTMMSMAIEPPKQKIPSILKNILFLGNDYISVENIDLDRGYRRTFQVYAIDNLEDKKPIKLTDLIGENGKDIFSESARTVMSIDPNIVANEENVGLIRRNGYWIMKGRINYKQNDEELYKDFNIKAIPPKEMVSYDEQTIPWDAIRLIVPDVIDVFSSPNNEFVVVMTSSHLVVYYIEDGDIVNNPVARIKLPYDSSIIMSEWAVGRYANIWQNEIINNGGGEIEY